MNERKSILIIDDDESSRKSIALIFRSKGYEIETAGSGQEAVKKAQDKFFNVAFLDIKLPDGEGTEFLACLKEMRPEMDVIMVTGYASLENAVRALNEGASAYITKPLNIDELTARVREFLEKQHLAFEKKKAEEKLRQSEERLKEAQRIGRIGNWELDAKTGQIIWSDQVYSLFERNPTQGPPTYEENMAYYYPEDSRRLKNQLQRAIEFGEEFDSDYHLNLPSGRSVYHRFIIKTVKNEDGHIIKLFGAIQDITERKQAEEQLKASLKEKEVLIKEIHHRVKNNMQLIYSLLSLQSESIKDRGVLNRIKETQHRVRSMALIHERLYQSEDLARIGFGDYVQKLVMSLFNSFGVDSRRIKHMINIKNVFLDVNTAIPCGLIINELVSNSLKHAFPKGKGRNARDSMRGEICIELRLDEQDKFTLIVRDNGVGFPEDVDFRNTKSLGLQIVNTLVEQLEGDMEIQRNRGTTFKIKFAPP